MILAPRLALLGPRALGLAARGAGSGPPPPISSRGTQHLPSRSPTSSSWQNRDRALLPSAPQSSGSSSGFPQTDRAASVDGSLSSRAGGGHRKEWVLWGRGAGSPGSTFGVQSHPTPTMAGRCSARSLDELGPPSMGVLLRLWPGDSIDPGPLTTAAPPGAGSSVGPGSGTVGCPWEHRRVSASHLPAHHQTGFLA